MSILLGAEDVRRQSLTVWGQFKDLWIENATENAKLESGDMNELEHLGVGKFAVLVAMGASLESKVEILKKYRDRVDVICCDKAFGPLLDHGVKADYVVVADAGIRYQHIENYIRETKGVTLFSTPYANPVWTKMWKGPRYFYVNQDSIGTEHTFKQIMKKGIRMVPAGSNVSNSMVILLMDCTEKKNVNWSGYERIFLLGYDYSWQENGNYYAWENSKPKRNYMKHRTFPLKEGMTFSSENLIFSAKWLCSYVSSFSLPVVNCGGRGIADLIVKGDLEKELSRINPNQNMSNAVRDIFHSWKLAFESYKFAEKNFINQRRKLLWQ